MHKIFILFLTLSASCFSCTDNWITLWEESHSHIENQNFEEARSLFKKITTQNQEGNFDLPSFFHLDVAKVALRLEKYDEAIEEASFVINDPMALKADVVKALWIRAVANYKSGNHDGALQDYEEVYVLDQRMPKTEIWGKICIIRNLPAMCCCQKKFFSETAVELGLCKGESDVKFHDDLCTIKLSFCKCGCQEAGFLNMPEDKRRTIEACNQICAVTFTAAAVWCAKLPSIFCQGACMGVIELMKIKCMKCCSQGTFYEDCVKPFEDIANRMPAMCDPLRDDEFNW